MLVLVTIFLVMPVLVTIFLIMTMLMTISAFTLAQHSLTILKSFLFFLGEECSIIVLLFISAAVIVYISDYMIDVNVLILCIVN